MFEITQAQLEQMRTCVKRTQCQPDCPYSNWDFDCIVIHNLETDLPNYSYRLFKGLEAALAKLKAATELLKKADELTDRLIKENAEVIAERDFLAGELGGLPCYTRRDWQCPDFVPGGQFHCEIAKATNILDEKAYRNLRTYCYSRYAAAQRERGV